MRFGLCCSLLVPALLPAQFDLTVRTGFVAHGPHATDAAASGAPSFRPGSGGEAALGLGVVAGDWRIAVGYRRAPADLVLRGDDAGIITPDAIAAHGLTLELGRRIAGPATGSTLHVLLGAERTSWSFPGLDEPTRSGWGGVVALEGAVPFGRRVAGVVRVEGARSASLFTEEELPDGFSREAANRVGLSVGIRVRQ